MSFHQTVLYPALEEGQHFDMEYYRTEHLRLVKEAWGARGLVSWKVLKFNPQPDGTPAPYHAGALLVWESAEAAKEALASPATKGVIEDITNFTNTKSSHLTASVEASSD
jgi:uncharacterized protein (TIGR02118 family)